MRVPSHNPEVDFEIRADSPSDAYVIREQFCENVYNLHPTDLEDTKIVIDLGANIGAFSLFAASICNEAKIYAYEPDPDNLALLIQNCELVNPKLGKQVVTVSQGVSDYAGKASLLQQHGGSHLVGVNAPVDRTGNYGKLEQKTVGIDLISLKQALDLTKSEFVDVLKIDVEGHEYAILLGPDKNLLHRFRFITMEFEPNPQFGELVALLAETHSVKITGKADQGGYIHARRY